jgi:hypothetical protein
LGANPVTGADRGARRPIWHPKGDRPTEVLELTAVSAFRSYASTVGNDSTEQITVQAVVDGIRREHARLKAAVGSLGEAALTVRVTEDSPTGWTAKDVLGHLLHYFGQIVLGSAPTSDLPPMSWRHPRPSRVRGYRPRGHIRGFNRGCA